MPDSLPPRQPKATAGPFPLPSGTSRPAALDERVYCALYPDIAAAVTHGVLASGHAHYAQGGEAEIVDGVRKSPLLLGAPASATLPALLAVLSRVSTLNTRPWSFLRPDEAELVDGFAAAAFEGAYIDLQADLQMARQGGTLASGMSHWLAFGRREVAQGRRVVVGAWTAPVEAEPEVRALTAAVQDWGAVLRGCAGGNPGEGWFEVMEPVGKPLQGQIDSLTARRVRGWAFDGGGPVTLSVQVDGAVVGRVIANAYRGDLERHGLGDGRHAFEHSFQPELSGLRHVVRLLRETDEADLPTSPGILAGSGRFDLAVRQGISAAVDAAGTEAELQTRAGFLAGEVERLLRRRSELLGKREERLGEQQFRRRWGPAAQADPGLVTRKRALIIDSVLPVCGRDAGSAAVVSHALSLQRLGYEVVLATTDMAGARPDALERQGIACCLAPWFGSVEEVLRLQAHGFDLVYLHRVETAQFYLGLVRHHQPRAQVVFSVADLQHQRLERQASVESRPELVSQARIVRRHELLAATESNAVITHSAAEAEMLRKAVPGLRVHVVPWAIEATPGPVPFETRSGIGFIGHYGYAPNVDAALWLCDEVMPAVLQMDPGITCRLAGTNMVAVLREPRPGVEAVGAVADLSAFFGGLRLSVAPLQYGAGIKGKVLDSLAEGVPCVCTPVAAEGLALGPALSSLVAADAAGFAAAVHRLYSDPVLHAACRAEGLDYVQRELNTGRIDELLGAAIG